MLNYVLLIGTICLLLILFYAIIPALLTRVFKKFAMHKLENCHNKQIALTFDDGPHPVYTPILLDLLQSKSIKATFFILGSEAEKNPAIIKRMHEDGHLIGIHNYTHICNWLLSPNALKNQIEKTANIIHKITKSEPKYYRPPWGLISLPNIFNKKYQTVLWSVMAYDWDNKNGSDEILNLLKKQTKPGSIILLHDNGNTFGADEDAPTNTIKALEDFIDYCFRNDFQFVRIDEKCKQREK